MNYPIFHKEIVNDLLEGKFLLSSDFEKFNSLKKAEEKSFYSAFFNETFGYQLKIRNDFAYLVSETTNETLSRNFTLFLCLICYELNKKNKDFINHITIKVFSCNEIIGYLKNSVFEDIVIEIGSPENLLKKLAKRNIIEWINKDILSFKFTSAIDLFLEFALDLSKNIETDV